MDSDGKGKTCITNNKKRLGGSKNDTTRKNPISHRREGYAWA